jgi:hypothetical protein
MGHAQCHYILPNPCKFVPDANISAPTTSVLIFNHKNLFDYSHEKLKPWIKLIFV